MQQEILGSDEESSDLLGDLQPDMSLFLSQLSNCYQTELQFAAPDKQPTICLNNITFTNEFSITFKLRIRRVSKQPPLPKSFLFAEPSELNLIHPRGGGLQSGCKLFWT